MIFPAILHNAGVQLSDAHVETELYGRCRLQPVTYLTKHAHAQGRKLATFSPASVGNMGLPQSFAG